MAMGTRRVGLLVVGAALLGGATVGCARSGMATAAPREDTQSRPLEDEAKKRCDYEDPTRYYVSRDAERCAVIRYVCPNPEDSASRPNFFSDRCGCGCEAAPAP